MKTANLQTEALRQGDAGQFWEEVISGTTGTINLPKQTTFRVRALGATTVTIDGILAMTMMTGEIAIFNVGTGSMLDTNKPLIAVVIAVAGAYVQVSREKARDRLQPNPYNLLNEPVGTGESP